MGWDEKLRTTIADSQTVSNLKIVFRSAGPADERFITHLREQYPFIAGDYCRFLAITDGAGLWMYEFFGSGASRMPAIRDLINRWRPISEKLQVFPFAEDPEGNCISMRINGEIIQYGVEIESDSHCIVLANSFGDFLDHMLMGEGFYSLFEVPPTEIENNEWLDYLKQKGWLQ
ncbi:hypothetical protein DTL21_06245 [Bremerella cremea]|uniref:SMI1/KNR4 family protein n=1 Tax=Blastopirellula marina TaxID=124 RepID=A0A2S8FZC4_9BACT|nr:MULTISPECIES: SMI1/KNR4 family protein [Pirellulaceae]PQO37542.1 hypothetical protein C5Y83_06245 [Blastopirellula marina]RCS49929.1 hypothetical protein DTL21_06245 [Bremerella cremea]